MRSSGKLLSFHSVRFAWVLAEDPPAKSPSRFWFALPLLFRNWWSPWARDLNLLFLSTYCCFFVCLNGAPVWEALPKFIVLHW